METIQSAKRGSKRLKELEDTDMVKRFLKIFCYKDFLGFWYDEAEKGENPKILIADPSRICGIVFTDDVIDGSDKATEWQDYMFKGWKPSKKNYNLICFDDVFYSGRFFEALLTYLDNIPIMKIRMACDTLKQICIILFKINETFSIGMANRFDDDLINEKEYVVFIDKILNDKGNFEKVGQESVEWKDGKAIRSTSIYGKDYKTVVYHKDLLFEKIEEEGDSLLI